MLNDQNEVVNISGDYLLDVNNNRIRLSDNVQSRTAMPDSAIGIAADGTIFDRRDKDRVARAKVKLVEFTDAPSAEDDRSQTFEVLKKYGLDMPTDNALLQAIDPAPAVNNEARFQLKQGYLESSNVDIVNEMVMLMMTSKDYDMSQKIIAAEDKIMDKSINEMGRMQ
jgi:flagellar basal-body rod protein FlgG